MTHEKKIKGVDLIGLIISLKTWQKRTGRSVPDLHPDDLPFIRGPLRVLPSSWYPFDTFLRLLKTTHELCYGGTEEGMIQMGRDAAAIAYGGVHAVFVKENDFRSSVRSFKGQWRQHFNFGSLHVTDIPGGIRILFDDFHSVGRLHSTLHVGWFLHLAEICGAKDVSCRIVEAPWINAKRLLLELTFR